MFESIAQRKIIPRIELMVGQYANPEVVKEMKSREYRLKVLRQMIEQKFLTAKIDVEDPSQLEKLDSKIVALIQESFGDEVIANDEANRLYIELCFNQTLLDKAFDALKAAKGYQTHVQ